MDIRPISPRYAVSAQISVDDVPAIAKAGIVTVICNRPDSEVPVQQQAAAIRAAVEAAGLRFEVLELTMQTMTPQNIASQHAMVAESAGPVLAYCRSGTRCSIVWALAQAGNMETDEILATTASAGYPLADLRSTLDRLSRTGD